MELTYRRETCNEYIDVMLVAVVRHQYMRCQEG